MTTFRKEAFKFGVCTSATFGAVTVDMVTIPGPSGVVSVEDQNIGGAKRSLDGTMRMDRFAMKRKFSLTPWPYAQNTEYWSVLRFWKSYQGPYIFFDHTVANLLSSDQKLLLSWTNYAGALVSPRADGALTLVAGAGAQMGPSAGPQPFQVVPVTPGLAYTFGVGLCGAGGAIPGATWQASMTISWLTISSTLITSGTVTFNGSTPSSTFPYLNGSLQAGRFFFTGGAPVGAAYAQITMVNTGSSSVDILDPCIIPGPNDPGNAYTLVLITGLPETHEHPQYASLSLTMEEV